MADDKHDQPLASQTIGAANGKDVLYGWLVGRAAADLGLAQAIAASEAQRAEQIKRLEEAVYRLVPNHHVYAIRAICDQSKKGATLILRESFLFGNIDGQ